MGITVADYDGDGWQDLYVTGIGRNFLFQNKANGQFSDVAKSAGLAGGSWSTGAAFADLDKDGDLDLYVANYLDYPLNPPPKPDPTRNYRGYPVFCGPRGLPGARDALYINDGHGTFHDVAQRLEIDPDKLYGLGVVIADIDNDTWPDIVVATDLTPHLLYRNRGNGTFEETAIIGGARITVIAGSRQVREIMVGNRHCNAVRGDIQTQKSYFRHATNSFRMRLCAAASSDSQRNPRHCDSGLVAPY